MQVMFRFLNRANHLVCRVIFRLVSPPSPPLPEAGPVILVSNHVSFSDPLVLLATAGRPIRFLIAREIYERPRLRWVFRALNGIPLSRGTSDVGAVRAVLRALQSGDVIGIFPEGGVLKHRKESGHLGVGYLALKTGAPIVPASISWDKPRPLTLLGTLLKPGKAVVRYGTPIVVEPDPRPGSEEILAMTRSVMDRIKDLERCSA